MKFDEWFEWFRAETDANTKSLYSTVQEKVNKQVLDLFAKDAFKAGHNVALHRLLEYVGDAEGVSKSRIREFLEQ